jgi:hypothetical protein
MLMFGGHVKHGASAKRSITVFTITAWECQFVSIQSQQRMRCTTRVGHRRRLLDRDSSPYNLQQ